MKKLKLKLQGKEMLSKEQMKNIQGGYDFNSCTIVCAGGAPKYSIRGDSCETTSEYYYYQGNWYFTTCIRSSSSGIICCPPQGVPHEA